MTDIPFIFILTAPDDSNRHRLTYLWAVSFHHASGKDPAFSRRHIARLSSAPCCTPNLSRIFYLLYGCRARPSMAVCPIMANLLYLLLDSSHCGTWYHTAMPLLRTAMSRSGYFRSTTSEGSCSYDSVIGGIYETLFQ